MNKRVLIRFPFGKEIGLGHFYRCYSLALILKDKVSVILAPSLQKESLEFFQDKSKTLDNVILDDDAFINQINNNDIVILDRCLYGKSPLIKEKCSKLILIDDNNEQSLEADAVINHNFHAKELKYNLSSTPILFTGPEYAMIRPAFLNSASSECSGISNILLTAGGADPQNLTLKLIKSLERINLKSELAVLLGGLNPHQDMIEKYREQSKLNIKTYSNLDEEQMVSLIKNNDLIICPASSMSIECIYLNRPIITGMFYPDQHISCSMIEKLGLGLNLGDINKTSDNEISEKLNCFLKNTRAIENIRNNQMNMTKKKGQNKITRYILGK